MKRPEWSTFAAIRHFIVFTLGIVIIIDGLASDHDTIPELIIGMVMVGVLPLDTFWFARHKQSIDHSGKREIEREHGAPE